MQQYAYSTASIIGECAADAKYASATASIIGEWTIEVKCIWATASIIGECANRCYSMHMPLHPLLESEQGRYKYAWATVSIIGECAIDTKATASIIGQWAIEIQSTLEPLRPLLESVQQMRRTWLEPRWEMPRKCLMGNVGNVWWARLKEMNVGNVWWASYRISLRGEVSLVPA